MVSLYHLFNIIQKDILGVLSGDISFRHFVSKQFNKMRFNNNRIKLILESDSSYSITCDWLKLVINFFDSLSDFFDLTKFIFFLIYKCLEKNSSYMYT